MNRINQLIQNLIYLSKINLKNRESLSDQLRDFIKKKNKQLNKQ